MIPNTFLGGFIVDVFLSWSTERSKVIGKLVNDWLSNVFPTLDIYYSPEKIEAGQKWRDSVGEGLKDNYIGLFFLVEENITSEWINFEAGAISNTVGEARVIPVLHDLNPEQISGPLSQFQAQKLNKNGLHAIVSVINKSLDEKRQIGLEKMNTIFEKWYPDFEEAYELFKKENPTITENKTSKKPGILDESGQIGEILNAVRRLERKIDDSSFDQQINFGKRETSQDIIYKKIGKLISENPSMITSTDRKKMIDELFKSFKLRDFDLKNKNILESLDQDIEFD